MKRMRIWLPTIQAGSGADVFTQRLADAISDAGHTPILQWFDHRYELTPYRLKKIVAPSNIDIVHAGSWQGFAFKRRDIPLVITEHHYVLDPAFRPFKSLAQHLYHRGLINRYMRLSFSAADAITTDSVFTAEVLSSVVGISGSKVIPLWADYNVFVPRTDSVVTREDSSFRLLFVGNASVRKGADVIQGLARRLGDGFEIRCTAGLRAGRSNASCSNVFPLGRLSLDALIHEYQHCDAVLVPSRYEGFGYSALEGMACGKPVVGFRCGAVDEVVMDGETGLLSDIDDMDTLEANCRTLANDRPFTQALGAAGRSRALSTFSEHAGIDAYLSLYGELVSKSFIGGT
jgi:glycosyltransferase involved in cell wall biosynthesis